jgi:hypothetical protein
MRSFMASAALVLFALSSHGDLGAAPCPIDCQNAPPWQEGAGYRKGDRILGAAGNLWECKGGSLTRFCDDRGREPDVDAAAAEVWTLVEECLIADGPELSVTALASSAAGCNGSVTLSATIVNDSPFGFPVPVAFYRSSPRVLIGVVEAPLVGGDGSPETVNVSLVWNNPSPDSALITVVADDDGTGRSTAREHNEADNAASSVLPTCAP